jgi:hypothetical protein
MTAQLNYLVARRETAGLARDAERARLSRAAVQKRAPRGNRTRLGWFAAQVLLARP